IIEENSPRHSIPGRGQNIYLNLAEETVCSIPCNITVVQLLDVPSSSLYFQADYAENPA
ncbi:hypothetical protein K439DRAFT_1641991, partial [Ramaria rubella]